MKDLIQRRPDLQSGQALLPFRPPPLLVVQSSSRSPSACLLALYSNGDKAGVSPIIGTEAHLPRYEVKLPVLLPVITPASTNPANEVARKLTGRDYISWSSISTFRSCPLKYWFRYVAGLPEESVSSALVFGTGIHAAIEDLYRAELAGEANPDVEQPLCANDR